MKKLFFAISIAVLFLASCNFDGAKNINRAGTTSVEVPVYNFLSGILLEQTAATAGTTGAIGSTETSGTSSVTSNNEYSVKISFEGNDPDGAVLPEEIKGSKLEDFYGKTFSVKNIPVGAEVQFKITVSDKGGELYEGFSKVVKIKSGVQNIAIAMKRAVDYVPVWDFVADANGGERSEWFAKNLKNRFGTIKLNSEIPLFDSLNFVLDKEGNIYIATSHLDGIMVFRYSSASDFLKKTPVVYLSQYSESIQLYYDYSTDSLFLMNNNFDGLYEFYKVDKVSKIQETVELSSPVTSFTFWDNIFSYAVFNDKIYATCESGLAVWRNLGHEGEDDLFILEKEELLSAFKIEDNDDINFTDLAINEKGVFVLLNENSAIDPAASSFISRGGVIKLDHDLNIDNASISGFSRMLYSAEESNPKEGNSPKKFLQRIPQSISKGFYGPLKIYAIKEEELVFIDGGQWVDFSKNGEGTRNYKITYESHIVTLNLNQMTWTADSVDTKLVRFYNNSHMETVRDISSNPVKSSWTDEND